MVIEHWLYRILDVKEVLQECFPGRNVVANIVALDGHPQVHVVVTITESDEIPGEIVAHKVQEVRDWWVTFTHGQDAPSVIIMAAYI